ncbi:MAG: hypothetical protein B0D92_00580 [Spirochaeta sp. LUC14_002_19_P3]|nr:MAG: hypothetical protein B0D92_00580 [Spirochaeta sp. LUC14_002_19_P3]
MSWKTLDKISHHLTVRLILIVTLAAVFASLVVFGVLLGSLAMSFRAQDEAELDTRLLSYWAEWQYGGTEGILARADRDIKEYGGQPFLLLLKNPDGKVTGGIVPGGWEEFNLDNASLNMLHPGTYTILRNTKMDFSLLLTGIVLEDNSKIVVGISTENREFLLRFYKSNYPIALAGIILAGIAVGIIASRRLLKPIRRLNKEIDRIIVTGELSRRLGSSGSGDQLDELTGRYNRLLDRVESLIGSMKETLDAVAHDLRTPLTRIRGKAEIALSRGKSDDYENTLAEVVEQIDLAGELLSTLMDIAEAEQGMLKLNSTECDLSILAGEVIDMYEFVAEEKNQTIALDAPNPVFMYGDPARIRRILGNLVDNAVKYGTEGGQVDIRCFTEERKAVLEVIDDGPGIAEEEIPRVFDRLYRGDRSRGSRGLGLGLSVVKALLEAHKGHITISRAEGRGAIFRVEFPFL